MNYYETVYIINSSLDFDEIKGVKKDIDGFISTEGGDIYSRSDLGRTRLAYDIDKQRYGNYIVLRYSAKPSIIKSLNEKFGLMDNVLSFMSLTLDEEPERVDEEITVNQEEEKKREIPVAVEEKVEKINQDGDNEELAEVKTEEQPDEKDEEQSVVEAVVEEIAEPESGEESD